MLLGADRLWAAICLLLAAQLVIAQGFAGFQRQNQVAATTSGFLSPAPEPTTNTGNGDGTGNSFIGSDLVSSATITSKPSSTQNSTISATPTIATDGPLINSTYFNSTIAEGQLPLKPELTPGWGVAGIILLITGVVYTLVGIKNRWIHTFFSTAYLTALGVAVLIVYVMSNPVSNAVQGAYVVAVVMAGCAFGAAAMFFKDLTEGFGCALGGFCVSMWLLCLVPGGLLHTVMSKAIFIACFTLVGFAFYFSRWTRDWALIVMIAFAGSTITVLGIDCFSRAGLKEFWVYLWDINSNLFPLNAKTYPVTKGIRVETAAIIIIFLMGIISQIKLWRIVREKREKRAAERAEGQRNLEEEEENVGRQIEANNRRERREWERIYGDGTGESITESRATDIGETGSEKGLHPGYVRTSKRRSKGEVIEMADMSESDLSGHGSGALMATEEAQEGKVTVRVAADDIPESSTDVDLTDMDEKADGAGDYATHHHPSTKKRLSRGTTASKRISQTVTEVPEVVPLPFTVPQDDDAKSRGDRSSIATFADDVETAEPSPRKRKSLAKRLSQGSATLLRSFSQRSARTNGADEGSYEAGESQEELVIRKGKHQNDDEMSLAATVDDESISGGDAASLPQTQHEGQQDDDEKQESVNAGHHATGAKSIGTSRPVSTASVPGVTAAAENAAQTKHTASERGSSDSRAREGSSEMNRPEPSEAPKSIASASSIAASLTRERLPRSLSRVAMSYRTNEWAKHLSNAECPEPDELQLAKAQAKEKARKNKERTAPVDVEELQKTAEDGAPAPAIRRSASQVSDMSMARQVSRRSSKQDVPSVHAPTLPAQDTAATAENSAPPLSPVSPPPVTSPPPALRKSTSAALRRSSSGFEPIAEENPVPLSRSGGTIQEEEDTQLPQSNESSTVNLNSGGSPTLQHSASQASIPGVVSYSSPQTLLGQREMFLRNKSQGSLISNTPEPTFANQGGPGPGSDFGSIYNYPMYSSALSLADPDDVPLSQRKEIMRQSSLRSLTQSPSQPMMSLNRSSSAWTLGSNATDQHAFNSHQPQRASMVPAPAAREAKLATFRQSVQHELRSGTPIMTSTTRETPFATASLLGGREAEVQRNIEMQRTVLMGQKEAEAQRKEIKIREKQFADRAFDERMRNGDMLEAHREAMRKMQKGAR